MFMERTSFDTACKASELYKYILYHRDWAVSRKNTYQEAGENLQNMHQNSEPIVRYDAKGEKMGGWKVCSGKVGEMMYNRRIPKKT